MACLHADPAARPADAAAVATAVTRHIESAAARLHQAELGARSAAARAASERKVRRLTMVLALVVVTVVIGGAWTWTTALQRAQQRTQTAERRATAALLAAERRFAVADAPPADDLAAWNAAARAARGVLDQLDADSPPDLAARAHELQQRAQSLADDMEFCRALALAGADSTNTNRFDRRPMRHALRACFAAHRGAPIEASDAQAVASSLATLRWRDMLVTALDAWLRIELECDPASPVARRVHAVVDLLDEDPWRQRLRAANKDRDLAALRVLAADPAAEVEPASALRHLALALLHSSDVTAATGVLRRCIARFPGDFPALLDLGWMLLQSRTAEAGELMRYVQAALALRPSDPAALELSALALNYTGRPVDALASMAAR
ncbi:MAG: hypothetical protein KF830_12465 [Planctomycetes bacterium]|nr:hypothetical protein [Planctomycetota bacterium]